MAIKAKFGTDGIRGKANDGMITAENMLKAGQAAGIIAKKGNHRHRVIIGKDTRLSGYMIENALTAGFLSMGIDVLLVGPMPTPAVALITKSMRADLGVMISASHNLFQDNGIKFFAKNGHKLSLNQEQRIEELMNQNLENYLTSSRTIGKATRIDDVVGRYIESLKRTFPKKLTLDGLKIVIDCANGAAYKIGPTVLWELGADVVAINNHPNGFNINEDCGSTNPKALAKAVLKNKADIGIALDGDADRLTLVDNKGNLIDGDQIIAAIAASHKERELLRGDEIVATQMSNLGLENFLKSKKLKLIRTKVGDKYVFEQMLKNDINLGGEQSGHIILSDYSTTGDGMLAALQILAIMKLKNITAEKACKVFTAYPQITKNIPLTKNSQFNSTATQQLIAKSQQQLGDEGRILVRKSGTEPLIRIMAEGKNTAEIKKIADKIANSINIGKNKSLTSKKGVQNAWKSISDSWVRLRKWRRGSG
jgi:phosphoglucosamine mutase